MVFAVLALVIGSASADVFEAVRRGHSQEVQKYLDAGGDPNVRDAEGRSLLLIAASEPRGMGAMVAERLIKAGAEVNVRNADDAAPLFLFARSGSGSSAVEALLAHGADVNAAAKDGYTPLDAAVSLADDVYIDTIQHLRDHGGKGSTLPAAIVAGDVVTARRLLTRGADPNTPSHNRWTPLQWAAFDGRYNADIVQFLLDAGANVHGRDALGATPLHYVGSAEFARVLIRHGAEVEARDQSGQTPLHYAAHRGDLEVIRVLLQSGAKINAQDKDGDTPLCEAVRCCGGPDVIRFLLDHGADPNLGHPILQAPLAQGLDLVKLLIRNGANPRGVGPNGDTLLHYAAGEGRSDAVRFALDSGIDVNTRDRDGRTALWPAAHHDGIGGPTWSLLLSAGADLWVEDKEHFNIIDWAEIISAGDSFTEIPADLRARAAARNIHTAALHGSVDQVRTFLDRGVSPNARHPRDGKTPLHWAARQGHVDVVRLLLSRGANVNARDNDGSTPLRLARTLWGRCSSVDPALVKLLLDHGARE